MAKEPASPTNEMVVFSFGDKADVAPPSHLIADAPQGNDSVSADDMAMPRIKLMQPLSPEVDGEKVKAGMFLNTISGRAYNELIVVNLHFHRSFAVYKKRDLGGGFVGSAETEAAAQELVAGNPGNASDYEIQETARHTLVVLDPVTGEPTETVALFLSSKSALYSSRAWNTEIQTVGAKTDRFAMAWKLSSEKVSNSKGSWYNINTEFLGWAPQALHAEMKKLFAAINGAQIAEAA